MYKRLGRMPDRIKRQADKTYLEKEIWWRSVFDKYGCLVPTDNTKNLVTTNFTLWVLNLAVGVQVLKMSHYRHKRKLVTTFQDSAHSLRVPFIIDFVPLAYCRLENAGCSSYNAANMDVNSEQVTLVRISASLELRTIMVTLHYKAACDKINLQDVI